MDLSDVCSFLENSLGAKLLSEDEEEWLLCLNQLPRASYVPAQYKPSFIDYQREYFTDVYEEYRDCSMILQRGGVPIGIFPLCLYKQSNRINIGSLGGDIVEPLFIGLPKAETQRKVIHGILEAFAHVAELEPTLSDTLCSHITIMDNGSSQWQRKWMELGASCTDVRWWAYADLNLSTEERNHRMRRTNKYSVEKAREDYEIKIFDSIDGIDDAFAVFRSLHSRISGRKTRSKATWDIQRDSIKANEDNTGYDFVVFLIDRTSGETAGAALFVATPQTGLYAVAAYDRERFSKPVGHVAQAVAMDYMQHKGVRWYEIGERAYPSEGVDEKLINIGKYKEGFATHIFPRIKMELDIRKIGDLKK